MKEKSLSEIQYLSGDGIVSVGLCPLVKQRHDVKAIYHPGTGGLDRIRSKHASSIISVSHGV